MKIIGICGTSGSGKSTVCSILEHHGVAVLDCDKIYHELTGAPSDCLRAIGKAFGDDLIREGKLDRAALRPIVFSDPEKLHDLNQLTHRFVLEELSSKLDKLRTKGQKICAIDAPLFFEAGLDTWCDVVCAVISPEEEQIQRICKRDGITKEDAKERVAKQIPSSVLREKVDVVIENKKDIAHLEMECRNLIARVLQ